MDTNKVKNLIAELNKIHPITKTDLMIWNYGVDYSGIDGAIPQNIYNELLKKEEYPSFHYATDCREWDYKVVDLYNISEYIYSAIENYIKYFTLCMEKMKETEYMHIDKKSDIYRKYKIYAIILFPNKDYGL